MTISQSRTLTIWLLTYLCRVMCEGAGNIVVRLSHCHCQLAHLMQQPSDNKTMTRFSETKSEVLIRWQLRLGFVCISNTLYLFIFSINGQCTCRLPLYMLSAICQSKP